MIMMSQKLVIGLMVVLVMLLGSGTNAETNSRKFSAKSVAGRPSVSGKQSSAIKQQRRPTNKLAKSSMFSAFFRSLVFEAEVMTAPMLLGVKQHRIIMQHSTFPLVQLDQWLVRCVVRMAVAIERCLAKRLGSKPDPLS
jgi:hypothetical protein